MAGSNRRRVRLGSLFVGGLLSAVSVFVATMGLLSIRPTLCDLVNQTPGLSCGPLDDPNVATTIVVASVPAAGALVCMLGRRNRRLRMRASLMANEARNLGRVWGMLSVVQTLCTTAALAVLLALTASSDVPLSTDGGPLTGSFVIAMVIGVVAALVLTGRRFERVEQREYTRAGWEFIPDPGQPDGAAPRTRPDFGHAGPEPQRCRCNSHEYCPVHPGRGLSDMSTHPNQLD